MKIGIDLGGSHIGIGVIDEDGKILQKKETDLKIEKNSSKVEQFIKTYLQSSVKELIQKYSIETIGVASPGTPKNGKITSLVNLGIQELDIIEILQEISHLPIKVHNDAKCAAVAEKRYGSLKEYSDAVFLCLGTGIGGAVFLNNQLLEAKRNPGFELGHMIIQKDGKLCNCGKRGCFETYCSIKRLKNELINLLELKQEVTGQELLEILKQCKEEGKIQEIIDNYVNDLMIGLSNLIDIFEPEAICLGGGFVYFKDILYKKLLEKYQTECIVFNKQEMPDLKLAMLGNDAGIIGAGEIEIEFGI